MPAGSPRLSVYVVLTSIELGMVVRVSRLPDNITVLFLQVPCSHPQEEPC